MSIPKIAIPVNLANPGQFFACCGLLEFAHRLWPDTEGWFRCDLFYLQSRQAAFAELADCLYGLQVENTMSAEQRERLKMLRDMSGAQLKAQPALEAEKKKLESQRREEPIFLAGKTPIRVDWFRDDDSGGMRFKTWAGQQSVIDIATDMYLGFSQIPDLCESTLWSTATGIGLPFNFDSDLGAQGAPLDIGFSFDPLAASKGTRIEQSCKPGVEFLSFVGLQRFRPRALTDGKRFLYAAWNQPLPPSAAAAATCQAIALRDSQLYEFRLLYRTKYLKSFLPAQPYQEIGINKRRPK